MPTVFPIGPVKNNPVELWDFSYKVNLRGPVLIARKFLPAMFERKHGVFVCVSSSVQPHTLALMRFLKQRKLN